MLALSFAVGIIVLAGSVYIVDQIHLLTELDRKSYGIPDNTNIIVTDNSVHLTNNNLVVRPELPDNILQ